MAKELIWSEESEYVYGRQAEFANKEDFAKEVKSQYEDGECNVQDVKIEPCLYSERTLPGDHLIPLSLEEVSIENYYSARVEQAEGCCVDCEDEIYTGHDEAGSYCDSCGYRPSPISEL